MSESVFMAAAIIVALLIGFWLVWRGRLVVGVSDWERAALYRDGAFERLLPPGRHIVWGGRGQGRGVHVDRIALTPQHLAIGPVDAVSSDRMPLRLGATVVYRIADPELAVREPAWAPLQLTASTALARLAANHDLQGLITHGPELDQAFAEALDETAGGDAKGGLGAAEIVSAHVTGVILPPELRRLMSEVERARLEGLAALERARGEQAALRALANAARLLKDNPELERLRTLQAVADARNATLVLGGATPPPRP